MIRSASARSKVGEGGIPGCLISVPYTVSVDDKKRVSKDNHRYSSALITKSLFDRYANTMLFVPSATRMDEISGTPRLGTRSVSYKVNAAHRLGE
jgi:hypothetical protein